MAAHVDASEVKRMLASARRALSNPRKAVIAALEVYRDGIAGRAPRKTGDLIANFKIKMTGNASHVSGEVSSDQVKATTQEFGAWIGPKRRKALKFAGSPVTYMRKPVHVPARPYVAPTFQSDSDRAVAAFADELDRSIRF